MHSTPKWHGSGCFWLGAGRCHATLRGNNTRRAALTQSHVRSNETCGGCRQLARKEPSPAPRRLPIGRLGAVLKWPCVLHNIGQNMSNAGHVRWRPQHADRPENHMEAHVIRAACMAEPLRFRRQGWGERHPVGGKLSLHVMLGVWTKRSISHIRFCVVARCRRPMRNVLAAAGEASAAQTRQSDAHTRSVQTSFGDLSASSHQTAAIGASASGRCSHSVRLRALQTHPGARFGYWQGAIFAGCNSAGTSPKNVRQYMPSCCNLGHNVSDWEQLRSN